MRQSISKGFTWIYRRHYFSTSGRFGHGQNYSWWRKVWRRQFQRLKIDILSLCTYKLFRLKGLLRNSRRHYFSTSGGFGHGQNYSWWKSNDAGNFKGWKLIYYAQWLQRQCILIFSVRNSRRHTFPPPAGLAKAKIAGGGKVWCRVFLKKSFKTK